MLAYLHIPFCDSKCSYCAFNSYTHLHTLREDYMRAVTLQLQADIERFNVPEKGLKTLFIGGGTPSTVKPELYQPFFDVIHPYLKEDAEITSEANPNSATLSWLEGMKKLGVNRISFGTQSFDPEKLKLLNRAHGPEDTIRAVNDAYAIGIKNLSIDLIYATALDTKELLEHDLDQAFKLPINHISAYALTIEEGTVLAMQPEVAAEKLELTQWFIDEIQKRGFPHYEISNFGTYQSIHNRGYWEYDDYLGIGSGAVGCVKSVRYYPQTDVQAYIQEPLKRSEERLSNEDEKIEKLLLGMRSVVGFPWEELNSDELQRAELLIREGKLYKKGDKIYNRDFLLADEIALFID